MTTATIANERNNVRDGAADLIASRAAADTSTSSPGRREACGDPRRGEG
jgi:hypothetical protein